MSLDTLYTLFSSTLAFFDISAPKDEAGNAIPLQYSFNTSGAIL